jgi:hypothetical protein
MYWAFLFKVFLFSAVCSVGEFQMVSPEPDPHCGALHSVGALWAYRRIKDYFVRAPFATKPAAFPLPPVRTGIVFSPIDKMYI